MRFVFFILTLNHWLAAHYRYTLASGSADNIKQWTFPDGNFIQNLSGHNAIINAMAVNSDGVLVSGGMKTSFTFSNRDILVPSRTGDSCLNKKYIVYMLRLK